MPYRNLCRYLALTYSVGPSSVVWSELGLAPFFHQWECLECNGNELSVSCVKWPPQYILFYHVWGPAWIEIHWNSIWLRARSHMTSHYTWGSVTTLQDFGGVLGRPLDTIFWALTISWSRFGARVWSGPQLEYDCSRSQYFQVQLVTCWQLLVFLQ
jgi:hypothetical protein